MYERFPTLLKVEISDNGAGIPPYLIERLSDQFVSFKAKNSDSGTGVSLLLAFQIIEAHSGTIVARSKGVGNGSTLSEHLTRKVLD
ncbi:MAG: ATP-binding protein [Candidatus Hodarchaeales archaeon]